jgi:ABC-type dipeptide/oligopeptide/nickel transport system permease component
MLGGLLVVTVCVVVGNLLADIAYAWIDPRIRLGGRA